MCRLCQQRDGVRPEAAYCLDDRKRQKQYQRRAQTSCARVPGMIVPMPTVPTVFVSSVIVPAVIVPAVIRPTFVVALECMIVVGVTVCM